MAERTFTGHRNRKFTINSKVVSSETSAMIVSGSEDNKVPNCMYFLCMNAHDRVASYACDLLFVLFLLLFV